MGTEPQRERESYQSKESSNGLNQTFPWPFSLKPPKRIKCSHFIFTDTPFLALDLSSRVPTNKPRHNQSGHLNNSVHTTALVPLFHLLWVNHQGTGKRCLKKGTLYIWNIGVSQAQIQNLSFG